MSQFWSPVVRQLEPYVPGEQPKVNDLVKLNTNENPFAPSPGVLAAMTACINADLRLYPDPNADALKQIIAGYYGLEKQQVFVGNGSDEVLAQAFCAFFQGKKPILFPDITYSFYPVYCQLYGIAFQRVSLDELFCISPEDYRQPNGGIIFPNPNAPTGRVLDLAQIERVLQTNPENVVVIDEAYVDFGGESAVKLIARYPNLLVCQTLSKSRSLAGLRIGLALGQADLIEGLERVKNSFNSYPLDRVAQAGAAAAFADKAYFQATCRQVIANREQLTAALQALGFDVLPSCANFVFARHPQHDAVQLYQGLRAHNVLVRHFNQPRIEQFLRISIGTEQQQQRLLDAMKAVLAA